MTYNTHIVMPEWGHGIPHSLTLILPHMPSHTQYLKATINDISLDISMDGTISLWSYFMEDNSPDLELVIRYTQSGYSSAFTKVFLDGERAFSLFVCVCVRLCVHFWLLLLIVFLYLLPTS